MKLDLGCGTNKQMGFIGVDRFPLPDVDVVADIDKGLPFDDNSIDTIFASHSLEHVLDLTGAMKEIYRVCRHGAQICIVAPYSEQKLNISNPYHLHCFNEHTPRFWTTSPNTLIPQEQWVHPHASAWGLGESDHHELNIDLRCVKMEFFLFSRIY
ncbi:class I SAM-dependent methyltransferase [Paenibacillus sp. DMB20]|uniref:class I SAM-dependent methyltransferase n=1 Tax=Paenibacillus sp. DMB20 TaxID=1642570 RepID=UPI00069C4E55|nr:class I SAM-dependent methyltransferase [Paenibacillus sp. DMB20]